MAPRVPTPADLGGLCVLSFVGLVLWWDTLRTMRALTWNMFCPSTCKPSAKYAGTRFQKDAEEGKRALYCRLFKEGPILVVVLPPISSLNRAGVNWMLYTQGLSFFICALRRYRTPSSTTSRNHHCKKLHGYYICTVKLVLSTMVMVVNYIRGIFRSGMFLLEYCYSLNIIPLSTWSVFLLRRGITAPTPIVANRPHA